MALLACILWIVAGVLYVVYKFGEESSGSKAGGVGCVLIAVTAVAAFNAIFTFSEELTFVLIFGGFIYIFFYRGIREAIKEYRSSLAYKERVEIGIIRKYLPKPTRTQMTQFIDDLRSEEHPSRQQTKYLRKYQSSVLGEKHFLDMQAAWIYYTQYDTWSSERRRIFGDQDLRSKSYFDPTYKEVINDNL